MPNTGAFHILNLNAIYDDGGLLQTVTYVAVRCNACGNETAAGTDAIEVIEGGTVLSCAFCGRRQAVSNARLLECVDHLDTGEAEGS